MGPNEQYRQLLKQSGKLRHEESDIQASCVQWFRYQYPQFARLLIHVPNGGTRVKKEYIRKSDGKKMTYSPESIQLKRMGTTAGVSDLLLLVPRNSYGCLAIEMKTQEGAQSREQREWMDTLRGAGNKYEVCRSIDQFMQIISNYLNL